MTLKCLVASACSAAAVEQTRLTFSYSDIRTLKQWKTKLIFAVSTVIVTFNNKSADEGSNKPDT